MKSSATDGPSPVGPIGSEPPSSDSPAWSRLCAAVDALLVVDALVDAEAAVDALDNLGGTCAVLSAQCSSGIEGDLLPTLWRVSAVAAMPCARWSGAVVETDDRMFELAADVIAVCAAVRELKLSDHAYARSPKTSLTSLG